MFQRRTLQLGVIVTTVILYIMRFLLSYVPVPILGFISMYSRLSLRYLCQPWNRDHPAGLLSIFNARGKQKDNRYAYTYGIGDLCIHHASETLDIITHKTSDACQSNDYDVLIYIHGGGFTVDDCADILLANAIIASIESITQRQLRIYSMLYTITPSSSDRGTYMEVQSEICDTFQRIRQNERNLIGLVGDSAGGNLVLSLLLELQKQEPNIQNIVPAICLISPWLNLFSSDSIRTHSDFLSASWLRRCRYSYLGKNLQRYLENGYKLCQKQSNYTSAMNIRDWEKYCEIDTPDATLQYQNIDFERISPGFMSDTQLQRLPPTLIINGENELFFEDIDAFAKRLTQISDGPTALRRDRYVIGRKQVHAYPIFWTNPMFTVLQLFGLGWIFEIINYHVLRKVNENAAFKEQISAQKDRKTRMIFRHDELKLPVHSLEAHQAIQDIAEFLTKVKQ